VTIPRPPWYGKLQALIAPTDGAVKLGLVLVILACLALLLWGDGPARALALIYIVSP
jgi:hypothetical protein